MGLQVLGNTAKEGLLPKVAAQHSDDGATLKVTDVVEDLIHFESVLHGDFNWMRCAQGVELER